MPAGYVLYAGSPADFVANKAAGDGPQPLLTAPQASLSVYSDNLPGGSLVTDLLDASEAAVTAVTADSFGNFRFFAPENLGTLWVTTGDATAQRFVVNPATLADDVAAVPAAVEGYVGDALATGDPAPQYVLRGGGPGTWKFWNRTVAQGLPGPADNPGEGDLCALEA